MPKMKTVSAAKKRFRRVGNKKKIKATKAYHRHLLTKKTQKQKRGMRNTLYISKAEMKHMSVLLPYSV